MCGGCKKSPRIAPPCIFFIYFEIVAPIVLVILKREITLNPMLRDCKQHCCHITRSAKPSLLLSVLVCGVCFQWQHWYLLCWFNVAFTISGPRGKKRPWKRYTPSPQVGSHCWTHLVAGRAIVITKYGFVANFNKRLRYVCLVPIFIF